jgi:hypothetical protein
MQPTYLPWLGYFELMLNCDRFVYFDDVQFVKKSWQQRNRIKTVTGELMLSVPVLSKGMRDQKINQVHINNQENWQHKHLASIDNNYRKAAYFHQYINGLREIYLRRFDKLLDLNLALIEFLCHQIGIGTSTVLSSELDPQGDRNERIIDICLKIGADILYDAEGAAEILDQAAFERNGITLIFQHYRHPTYHQLHAGFIAYLSTLDLLFNEGDKSKEIIRSGGLT